MVGTLNHIHDTADESYIGAYFTYLRLWGAGRAFHYGRYIDVEINILSASNIYCMIESSCSAMVAFLTARGPIWLYGMGVKASREESDIIVSQMNHLSFLSFWSNYIYS
jgi:hypothetical protein